MNEENQTLLSILRKPSLLVSNRLILGHKNRFLFAICLIVLIFIFANNYDYLTCCYEFNLKVRTDTDLYNFSSESAQIRHFYTYPDQWCEGLANMMFRIASLYGIGKEIHRFPCLQLKSGCVESYQKELYTAFPNLKDFPIEKKCWNEPAYAIDFANTDPRIYENTTKLAILKDLPNLRLKSSYLQQVKYFEGLRKNILEIFKFNPSIDLAVDRYAEKLFNESTTTNKVCIHIRRGDFVTNKYLPLLASLLEFILPALNYVVQVAEEEYGQNGTSVMLFSDDSKFLKVVVDKFRVFNNHTPVYIPNKLNRVEYMNLASRYCHYYVLTASGSTFGWWTAYLMDDSRQSRVFYNSKIFRAHRNDSAKNFVESYFFPSQWRRLVLDRNSSTVYEEDRHRVELKPI